MDKKSDLVKDGILVTVGSLFMLAAVFGLYFLFFTIFETVANQDGSYEFVSTLRVGYGSSWLIVCLLIYRTKLPEWIKASVLTGSLTAFMTAVGVQFYETPATVAVIIGLVTALTVVVLYRMKKPWFHYYALGLSLVAGFIYL